MKAKTYIKGRFEKDLESLKKFQEFGEFDSRKQVEGIIFEIDKDKLVRSLDNIGAEKIAEGVQTILTYDFPDKSLIANYIEMRTKELNGETELQSKRIIFEDGKKARGEDELYFVLNDPQEVKNSLLAFGLENTGRQERERITYLLNGAKYNIDTWPGAPTYVGINVKNHDDLADATKAVGLDPSELVSIGGVEIFKKYGLTLENAVFDK